MAKDEASTGETAEPNTLKDRWGNERKWEGDRYPDGSAAKEGHITKPSGQGGSTPKARPDHQDMFPANPEPSESAKERGELNDRIEQGEAGVGEVVEQQVVPADRKASSSRESFAMSNTIEPQEGPNEDPDFGDADDEDAVDADDEDASVDPTK